MVSPHTDTHCNTNAYTYISICILRMHIYRMCGNWEPIARGRRYANSLDRMERPVWNLLHTTTQVNLFLRCLPDDLPRPFPLSSSHLQMMSFSLGDWGDWCGAAQHTRILDFKWFLNTITVFNTKHSYEEHCHIMEDNKISRWENQDALTALELFP